MDNNNMFKKTEPEIKVFSKKENQYYTLEQLLIRIEGLEAVYYKKPTLLANTRKFNNY